MAHISAQDVPTYTYHHEQDRLDSSDHHESTGRSYLPRWVSVTACILLVFSGFASIYLSGGYTFLPIAGLHGSAEVSSPPRPMNAPAAPAGQTSGQSRSSLPSEDSDEEPEPNALGHIKDEETRETLDRFVAEYGDTLYMYAADLETGGYAAYQPETSVPSGSIYKLFIAGEIFRQKTEGALDVSQPAGAKGWSIAQCTQQMVQNSSNACGEALRAKLGPQKITRSLHEQGYTNTDVAKDPAAKTSARDVALLLNRIYEGGYFTQEHTRKFEQYLKNQLYRFRIPEGIPREPAIRGDVGTRNKTGDVYGYTNDAAIVLGENTDYLLVILSGEWPSPTASSYVHRYISGTMYNFFNETDYQLPYTKPE